MYKETLTAAATRGDSSAIVALLTLEVLGEIVTELRKLNASGEKVGELCDLFAKHEQEYEQKHAPSDAETEPVKHGIVPELVTDLAELDPAPSPIDSVSRIADPVVETTGDDPRSADASESSDTPAPAVI